MNLDDLQRTFFDSLYTYRDPGRDSDRSSSPSSASPSPGERLVRGGAAPPRPSAGRSLVVALAVGLPLGYYLASPIWIRTELVEPDPVAGAIATPDTDVRPPRATASTPDRAVAGARTAAPRVPSADAVRRQRRRDRLVPRHGRLPLRRGTASIIETAPGRITLRLDDFSVRNGPDLFVYLSPDADDYADGALELGRLKATDGAFGYELRPARTRPTSRARSSGASSSRTCSRSRRSAPSERSDPTKVGAMASAERARTIPPVNATEGSVARYVARRNSDSSHG